MCSLFNYHPEQLLLQNVALRDIAHVVDMLSTQGMDDHQINAVARIRYLAHECLRDHGGSLIVEVANPQDDIVKRIRGKERVRRKSAGKRKRKEHLGLSHVETEGVRSGLCVVQMEADQSPLYHLNSELDHSQLCLPASEGEDAELCYLPNKVVETQGCLENQVDDSHFKHAVEAVDETQYAHMISVNTSVPSNADLDVVSQSSLESSKDVEHQNDYSVLV